MCACTHFGELVIIVLKHIGRFSVTVFMELREAFESVLDSTYQFSQCRRLRQVYRVQHVGLLDTYGSFVLIFLSADAPDDRCVCGVYIIRGQKIYMCREG